MQAERVPFLLVALVAVLGVIALSSAMYGVRESDDAVLTERDAQEFARAVKDAQAAKDKLEELMRELYELEDRIAQAINALPKIDSEADRTAARARLQQLLQEQDEMKQRAATARAHAEGVERLKCVCVPRACLDNPLATGCS